MPPVHMAGSMKGWLDGVGVGEPEPYWTPLGWTRRDVELLSNITGWLQKCWLHFECWPYRLLWKISKNFESSRRNLMEAMMFVQMDYMIEGLYFIINRLLDCLCGWHKSIFLFPFFHSSLVSVSCFVNIVQLFFLIRSANVALNTSLLDLWNILAYQCLWLEFVFDTWLQHQFTWHTLGELSHCRNNHPMSLLHRLSSSMYLYLAAATLSP